MNEAGNQGTNFLRELVDSAARSPMSTALIGMGALWLFGDRAWRDGGSAIRQASDAIGSTLSTSGGRSGAASSMDGLTELFRKQPLALGAIGIAIGAGLAAALPTSRLESEIAGDASDEFKEKARAFAKDQAVRAEETVERAMEAAAEEAQRQGLTPDAAKSAKDAITQKVGRVVDAAEDGVRERVKSTT